MTALAPADVAARLVALLPGLSEFVANEPDIHRHGDAIFVCTVGARIVVAHHEDRLFDLTSPRGT